MVIKLSKEREAFVEEVAAFVDKNYPKKLRDKQRNRQEFTREDYKLWHGILDDHGWGAVHWPKEYGGTGWDELDNYLFFSTLVKKNAHQVLPFGINMLAPLLMAFGNDAQKEFFLPKIKNADHIWCQGYSEPNAGSDLASLKMSAVKEGDNYVLNGSKIWTTLAQHADWIFCLVRTNKDSKPQAGISFILVDMKSPGITITPIITADRSHEVNQVIFDNVSVPADNLIGEENKGWDYAKYLLMFERSSFGANIAWLENVIENMKVAIKKASRLPQNDQTYLDVLKMKVIQTEADLLAAKLTMIRAITHTDKMHARKIASLLKVLVSRQIQAVTDLHLKLYQEFSVVNGAELAPNYFDGTFENQANLLGNQYLNHRKETIYAGSNEIQYNVIAKMILGL